jgi:hypothetical protein
MQATIVLRQLAARRGRVLARGPAHASPSAPRQASAPWSNSSDAAAYRMALRTDDVHSASSSVPSDLQSFRSWLLGRGVPHVFQRSSTVQANAFCKLTPSAKCNVLFIVHLSPLEVDRQARLDCLTQSLRRQATEGCEPAQVMPTEGDQRRQTLTFAQLQPRRLLFSTYDCDVQPCACLVAGVQTEREPTTAFSPIPPTIPLRLSSLIPKRSSWRTSWCPMTVVMGT